MANAVLSMLQVPLLLQPREHDPHSRRTWRIGQPRANLVGSRQVSQGEDGMNDFSLPASQFVDWVLWLPLGPHALVERHLSHPRATGVALSIRLIEPLRVTGTGHRRPG